MWVLKDVPFDPFESYIFLVNWQRILVEFLIRPFSRQEMP